MEEKEVACLRSQPAGLPR